MAQHSDPLPECYSATERCGRVSQSRAPPGVFLARGCGIFGNFEGARWACRSAWRAFGSGESASGNSQSAADEDVKLTFDHAELALSGPLHLLACMNASIRIIAHVTAQLSLKNHNLKCCGYEPQPPGCLALKIPAFFQQRLEVVDIFLSPKSLSTS